MKMVLATGNSGKIREMEYLFERSDIKTDIISLSDVDIADIEENGNSFTENAMIKSRTVFQKTGLPTLADDSGLCVDYLGGFPGIYSSRYSGKGDKDNIEKLLIELLGVPIEKRGAHFRCALCYTDEKGVSYTFENRIVGRIAEKQSGENGFGYDPVFYVPEKNATMAELPAEIKNRISHRALALKDFIGFLTKNRAASA